MNLGKVVFSSPLGEILIVARDESVCAVDYTDEWANIERRLRKRFGDFQLQDRSGSIDAVKHIRAYFDGGLEAIDAVDVDPGGTPFQQQVWKMLRKIPAGRTMTYGELANKIGLPGAGRAVGTANRTNPIAIIIPCHRVIGSNGALRGYAGGIDRKRWLLEHESRSDHP